MPGGKRLLPVRQIVENHRLLSEIVAQSDERSGDMIGWWWHPSWLPFAADARGDCFYCDERPGTDVPLGEFVHDGLAHRAPWTSIAAMLADVGLELAGDRLPLAGPILEHALQARILDLLRGLPEKTGSTSASLHRAFLDLKTLVMDDRTAVINEVERGEDRIRDKFRGALDKGLPAHLEGLIRTHYASIKADHDQISAMKHAAE